MLYQIDEYIICDTCGGHGIIRTMYKTIDWYKTRRKDDGKRYYMWAWDDKPCPECHPSTSVGDN